MLVADRNTADVNSRDSTDFAAGAHVLSAFTVATCLEVLRNWKSWNWKYVRKLQKCSESW